MNCNNSPQSNDLVAYQSAVWFAIIRTIHHIISVLQQLLWHPVKFQIDFKLLLYTLMSINKLIPPYVFDLLHTDTPTFILRLFP